MSDSYFIGIVGGSGSGKTTFVKDLKEAYKDKSVCIISLDDYYKPRDQQTSDKNGVKNFDLPGSIDHLALLNDLKELRKGNTVTRQEYTFNNSEAQKSLITYKPSKVYIIEGLFVYHYTEVGAFCDLRIFIDAKSNIKVIRRIKRDRIERNYDLEDVLYRYENHVLPSFEKYIKPYQDSAHLVINNNDSFTQAYQVLTAFIDAKLSQ